MDSVITDKYSLYHGDCIEVMQSIETSSVDCILVDPPYGCTSMSWDSVIPLDLLWAQFKRIAKPNAAILLFGSGLFTIDLINSNRKLLDIT